MASLSLKIGVDGSKTTKTMQFEPSCIVFDACNIIRQKHPEANIDNPNDFGLFLSDDDPKKAQWLDKRHTLEYYLLRNGDQLEYKRKLRYLKVKTLDETVKAMQVDDSLAVSNLMITICSKMGITNHEEYSLVHELADEEKYKTLTMKRGKSIAKDQKKLDEMKKKLHTDDELNWLDHNKTLREQGVEVTDILLLRRKYFFSDQNVDARDPVQLNLLYVQTRDAILKGAHPVSQDEAITFAGLQCQIQFGDHVPSKHKPGFLDLQEFLPKEYLKVKAIEKKIYQKHSTVSGLTEVEGKVKYTQMARSLKTYGITFFLVKEKMKGRNKLVPRLLGITKECVVRVDERTKEVVKEYPLTQVRRWAASPNSFTLDFGDYQENYYSVQTQEGEQIAQLIAGYIDIILKKKKAADHLGIDGNEESFTYEDEVSQQKAMVIQNKSSKMGQGQLGNVALPAVLRAGETGQPQISTGTMQKGQNAQTVGLGQAQRALLGTIDDGLSAVNAARDDLVQKADLPPLGTDPASLKWREEQKDMSKQNVGAHLSAMNAATAQVVTLTSAGDDTDYNAVGSAVATISSNVGHFAKDVKMLAALEEDENDGDKLMDAARRLAGAFSDLLDAAQPGEKDPRQNLINAASKIGEASHDIMQRVDDGDSSDRLYQDTLLALAKAVANATASLVLQAKKVSGTCDNQEDQNVVIGSATQCALATSQLVACTKVVAPTIQDPANQKQLEEAARYVAKSVDGVVNTAQGVCDDDQSIGDLNAAATAVSQALHDLLQHIKKTQGRGVDEVDTILTATDQLFNNLGDRPEMVKQAKILAQATSKLVMDLRASAESNADSEQQKRLLEAAKALADATARMVEAAKGCASSPTDETKHEALRAATEQLRFVANSAGQSTQKKNVIKQLEQAAKNAASCATQCINASGGAGKTNRNAASQQALMEHCKHVADDIIPRLVQGIKGTMNQPESNTAHMALINAAQDMLPPGGKLVTSSKAAIPTVEDQASASSLNNAAKNLASALTDLRGALGRAQEECGSMEIDGAIAQVRALERDLEEIKKLANDGRLRPLPGQTADQSASQLGVQSKTVGSSMAQLLSAAAQGNENYTGIAARDTANALRIFTNAVRGVAATTNDNELQNNITDAARDVMDKSANLIEEAKKAVNNPQNPDTQPRLAAVAKTVINALSNCINCLPGLRDVDQAMKSVNAASNRLNSNQFPTTERSYQEIQITLKNNCVDLNQAASNIVSATARSPSEVATSSNRFSQAYENFVDSGMDMAGATKEPESRSQIVSSLRSVSISSSKLLVTTKSYITDPNAPNSKNLLTQAARSVTDSINHLLDICTTSAPGQKECDKALRRIQALRPMLDNPNEKLFDSSYYECLEHVIYNSRGLAEAMTGITANAKNNTIPGFCDSVGGFADSVVGLIEQSAQAAYLVGIADPHSVPGREGLVDQSQFARATQAIQMACSSLTNPAASKQQQDFRAVVLAAATTVAKHTSGLCNTCRMAASKTENPVAKRHFVQSAKDVANNTAGLVRAIKALDGDFSDENRRVCGEAAKPLLTAVEQLTTYASSPEFISVPAKISPVARQAQEPISSAGRSLIDGACNMVQAAKQLAVNPKDPPTYQKYASHSHGVSDALKRLVSSIKECAPGQKECDRAVNRINGALRELDQASLAAISQNLQPKNENSLQGFQESVIQSAKQMLELMEPLRDAAKNEAEKLGHLVTSLATYMEPLSRNAVGAASKSQNSQRQMAILDQSKTIAESALQVTYAAKEGGGNPKALKQHHAIDEMTNAMIENLREFIANMEDYASSAGAVNSMIENISKSMVMNVESAPPIDGGSYVDYQTDMVRLCKQIAHIAQDMVGKASTNVGELGGLANALTRDYNALSGQCRGAVATTNSQEIAQLLRKAIQELGSSCMDLVQDAGNVQNNPSDSFARRDLSDHSRKVTEKVSMLLGALQAGAKGTQACINAASTVSGIIGDLDTTIMFATAGTLNAEGDDAFSDHRENILKTAKALVEDTKTLVAGAASNQEQLANAAQSAVMTITKLAECVKQGAASLGSEQPEAQVLLINAVKDVASALSELISSTKNASGKPTNDPAMTTLKDSAKVMVTNVTSLLKTVKTVEDEAARGTRALESSIEVIGQEIKTYVSTDHVEKTISAEELIRFTKPITAATAKAVAAGNSGRQEDVIVAANMGRKAVSDLLRACKGASALAETGDVKHRVLHSGKVCSDAYKELLEQVGLIINRPTADSKQKMAMISKKVASAVTEIVHSAEAIKGDEWVDPNDPTVVAEAELLSAAGQIEAAARKLTQLQPRRMMNVKEVNQNLKFEEQILEAAKSIAAATAALVKAASAAQRELVAQGKVGAVSRNYEEDSQWSQGLISASFLVASATNSLCEAANAMVQGQASEEKLISSAKQVASTTAQLLVACKVKADMDSTAMQRLQHAGNAVKRATEALVRGAQQAAGNWDEEDGDLSINPRMVGGIAQIIQAQQTILEKEKELESARRKLEQIRRAKYKDRPVDYDSGSDF